jgi:hypothetical protein
MIVYVLERPDRGKSVRRSLSLRALVLNGRCLRLPPQSLHSFSFVEEPRTVIIHLKKTQGINQAFFLALLFCLGEIDFD